MPQIVQVDGAQAILTIYTNVVTAQIPLAERSRSVLVPGPDAEPDEQSRPIRSRTETITATADLFGDYWKRPTATNAFAFIPTTQSDRSIRMRSKPQRPGGIGYAETPFNYGDTDYRGVVLQAKDYNRTA